MLSVLAKRSARLLAGAAVAAAVVGGPPPSRRPRPRQRLVPVRRAGARLVSWTRGRRTSPKRSRRWRSADAEGPGRGAQHRGRRRSRRHRRRGRGAPLPSDVDLLVKARLAGLWEMPAGQMAQEKGDSERVARSARSIADQHVRSTPCVNAANEVSVRSSPPSPRRAEDSGSRRWRTRTRRASSTSIFVDRLRQAHGASTRRSRRPRRHAQRGRRKLAQQAEGFVHNHLPLLESTDLVDYNNMPRPAEPVGNPVVTGTGPPRRRGGPAPPRRGSTSRSIYAILLTCPGRRSHRHRRFLRPRWGVGRA